MAGYKDFVSGAVLTSAEVDDYLMRQTVMRFATAAARDSALSGVVTEGMLAYALDSGIVHIYNGSAWVAVSQTDSIASSGGTVRQRTGSAVTPGTGTTNYEVVNGRHCEFWMRFVAGASGGPSAADIIVNLPHNTGLTASDVIGGGYLYDASSGNTYYFQAIVESASEFRLLSLTSTTGASLGSASFTAALATSDVITAHLSYPTT